MIKVNALNKIIENELKEMSRGMHCRSELALFEKDGIQVQIVFTNDEYDKCEQLYTPYVDAKD